MWIRPLDRRIPLKLRRHVDLIHLGEACQQRHIQRILPLSAGVLLDHPAKPDRHILPSVDDLLHIKGEVSPVIRVFVHVPFRLVQN